MNHKLEISAKSIGFPEFLAQDPQQLYNAFHKLEEHDTPNWPLSAEPPSTGSSFLDSIGTSFLKAVFTGKLKTHISSTTCDNVKYIGVIWFKYFID